MFCNKHFTMVFAIATHYKMHKRFIFLFSNIYIDIGLEIDFSKGSFIIGKSNVLEFASAFL